MLQPVGLKYPCLRILLGGKHLIQIRLGQMKFVEFWPIYIVFQRHNIYMYAGKVFHFQHQIDHGIYPLSQCLRSKCILYQSILISFNFSTLSCALSISKHEGFKLLSFSPRLYLLLSHLIQIKNKRHRSCQPKKFSAAAAAAWQQSFGNDSSLAER